MHLSRCEKTPHFPEVDRETSPSRNACILGTQRREPDFLGRRNSVTDGIMTERERPAAGDSEPEEAARLIDALMAEPPKGLPSIVVVGDDAVFGITPAKRRPPRVP
jgi:hypothetical protein